MHSTVALCQYADIYTHAILESRWTWVFDIDTPLLEQVSYADRQMTALSPK